MEKSFLILWFVFNLCSSFALQENQTNKTSSKYQRLRDCLTSLGVDARNIVPRGNSTEYTELNFQFNTLNGYTQPRAYLVARKVSDVQNAVICCRKVKVRIVPRSGGHSYVKNGFGDSRSLVVDLSNLNQVSVDRRRMIADIETGAKNGQVSYILWKEDAIAANVVCPSVGIGGMALGGGYGYFARQFGLVTDNIIEMEMVDANGELLLINRNTNKDLFFALRGGGAGTYGIVTKFKFRVYPSPKSVVYGVYEYNFIDFPHFHKAWQSFITSNVPDNINTIIIMDPGKIKFEITCINLPGTKLMNGADVDGLLSSFSFPRAASKSIKLITHSEFILVANQKFTKTPLTHPAQVANLTKHIYTGWRKVKSIYVDKTLNKNETAELYELYKSFLKYGSVVIEQYGGGAINRISESSTSFIHRGKNLYQIQLSVFNPKGTTLRDGELALGTFYEKSRALFNHRESYQNYLDGDIKDFLARYYGSKLNKLIEAKVRVDPENIFHHPQSVPAVIA